MGGIRQNMTNEKRIELHQKFFAQAYQAASVSERTIAENEEKLDELEEIIVQAKAAYGGTDEANRVKKANLSKEEREKLLSKTGNPTVSDAINAPRVRVDRQTKADRFKAELIAQGLMSEEDANDVAKNISGARTVAKKAEVTKVTKDTAFVFNGAPKVEPEEEKPIEQGSKPKVNGGMTQESLLADLLEGVDLTSRDANRLQESYNTAALLVGKTINKLQPNKMILLGSRIAELRAAMEEQANGRMNRSNSTVTIVPSAPKEVSVQSNQPFDPSKLFGK